MIKASGGVKDREAALKYLVMGVNRIGTSSGIALAQNK
jgi:deoxyribose-phosphate aldolase